MRAFAGEIQRSQCTHRAIPAQFYRPRYACFNAVSRLGCAAPGTDMLCQRLSRHRAGSVRRYRHKPLCQRCQQRQHLVHILVCHNADEKDEFLPGEAVFQALHRGAHPVGVVAAVQQKGRAMPQQLKAARPAHRFQTPADGLFRDIPSPARSTRKAVMATAAFRGW